MKIKSIHIENFGKLKDFFMDFDDGLNVICRENEFGKSTIMAFIEMMFYGKQLNDRKQDVLVNNRKRYTPWDGSQMAGDIEFEAGGVNYNLHKEFKRTANTDIVVLLNKDTGSIVDIAKDEEIGNRFLDLDISSFEKSVFISTLGGFGGAGDSSEDLAARLSNLVSSKDESISGSEVVKRLTEAREGLVSKNGKNGLLRITQRDIEDKKNTKENLKVELEQYQAVKKRVDDIYSEIHNITTTRANLEETNEAIENEINCLSLKKIRDDITDKDNYAAQLLKGQFQEAELKLFIQNRINELNAIKVLKQQYNKMVAETDDDSIFIDDEEYKEFRTTTREIERLEKTADFINYNVIPAKEAYDRSEEEAKAETEHNAPLTRNNPAYAVVAIISVLAGAVMFMVLPPVAVGLLLLAAVMGFMAFQENKKNKSANEAINKEYEDRRNKLTRDRQDKYATYISLSNKLGDMCGAPINTQLNELYSQVSQSLIEAKHKKTSIMDSYGCNSDEEVDEQYNSSKEKIIKRKQLLLSENDIKDKEQNFLKAFETYTHLTDIKEADTVIENISEKLRELDNRENRIDAVIKSAGINRDQLDDEIQKLTSEKISNIPEVSQPDVNYYKQLLLNNKEEIAQLTSKISLLEQSYREESLKLRQPDTSMEQLDSELAELSVQEAEQKEYLDSVELAGRIMQESVDEIGREFGPSLNDTTAQIFAKLTGDEYETVSVEKNYEMRVKKASGTYREWKYLSNGTVDQAYLSLRFAVAKLITADGEKLPILLDDVFVQYDDNRFARAMEFLKEYSSNTQIIYFTCKNNSIVGPF